MPISPTNEKIIKRNVNSLLMSEYFIRFLLDDLLQKRTTVYSRTKNLNKMTKQNKERGKTEAKKGLNRHPYKCIINIKLSSNCMSFVREEGRTINFKRNGVARKEKIIWFRLAFRPVLPPPRTKVIDIEFCIQELKISLLDGKKCIHKIMI